MAIRYDEHGYVFLGTVIIVTLLIGLWVKSRLHRMIGRYVRA
ncbi:hypothetical protein ACFVZC_32805 [Streptomyces marokkonensis]|uniref:Uncharacterized protein n=1 Tax=Streptomyces marokkonensis TaxID=324855 RepID=A0ABW6QFV8_9ACTN